MITIYDGGQERALTDAEKALGDNRLDFMKRWFAIAISVGFATALSNMPWLKNGVIFDRSLPVDWNQLEQCARLATAAIATILSWDGYFQSISKKPLIDGERFSIDVFLVFVYLFLLLTSKFHYFWLWTHAFTFIVYILWDFLSINKFRRQYMIDGTENAIIPKIDEIYRGSFTDAENIYRGPAITITWLIYFIFLPISHNFLLNEENQRRPIATLAFSILVVAGLFTYRRDKKTKFTFFKRMLIICIGLLVVTVATVILGLGGQQITC